MTFKLTASFSEFHRPLVAEIGACPPEREKTQKTFNFFSFLKALSNLAFQVYKLLVFLSPPPPKCPQVLFQGRKEKGKVADLSEGDGNFPCNVVSIFTRKHSAVTSIHLMRNVL